MRNEQVNEVYRIDDVHRVVEKSRCNNRWALWKKVWTMNAAARNDHDDVMEPVLTNRKPYLHNGKMHESDFADFTCPTCGCDIGELHLPSMNIQNDDHYCPDCGQRIDWQAASLKYERGGNIDAQANVRQ